MLAAALSNVQGIAHVILYGFGELSQSLCGSFRPRSPASTSVHRSLPTINIVNSPYTRKGCSAFILTVTKNGGVRSTTPQVFSCRPVLFFTGAQRSKTDGTVKGTERRPVKVA